MAERMYINGAPADSVSAMDRGLSYGDGLFESVRLVGTDAPLWPRHMQRLQQSCQRLHLPVPDTEQLWREALQVSHGLPQAVVRIAVTRGVGPRGYRPPPSAQPTRIVAAFAAPPSDRATYRDGVRMRVCELRLAEQPLLAGMKHLNRLEQVLARAEWKDPAIAEGLLRDTHDRVISATMANLFAVVDGTLVTPALDRCGIAGVGRAEILATSPAIRVGELMVSDLLRADEVFLSSSVRGVLPVQSLGETVYRVGPITRQWQQHWRDLGFVMEQNT
ncbi:MAG: aminodeoxychorismate lyase [Rhodanobacter sp.]